MSKLMTDYTESLRYLAIISGLHVLLYLLIIENFNMLRHAS